MGENILARDLMVHEHELGGIRRDQTLGEAMDALVDLQADKAIPDALVVLDEDGRYEGILTARLLLRCLATRAPADDERPLLDVVRRRLGVKIHDALKRDLPTVAPTDRLLPLIRLASDQRPEYLPVVENGHVRGLVPVTRIFLSAASLALTPEDEGIRSDPTRKRTT